MAALMVVGLPACLSNNESDQINKEQSTDEKLDAAICPLLSPYINDELIIPQERYYIYVSCKVFQLLHYIQHKNLYWNMPYNI